MPVSDQYLVQYLLQETRRPQEGIVWREGGAEASYSASVGSLEVTLGAIPHRGGERVSLCFHGSDEDFHIVEPLADGWLSRHYSDPDERALSSLLRDLIRMVGTQCRERRGNAQRDPDALRDRVFRQLMAGVAE